MRDASCQYAQAFEFLGVLHLLFKFSSLLLRALTFGDLSEKPDKEVLGADSHDLPADVAVHHTAVFPEKGDVSDDG